MKGGSAAPVARSTSQKRDSTGATSRRAGESQSAAGARRQTIVSPKRAIPTLTIAQRTVASASGAQQAAISVGTQLIKSRSGLATSEPWLIRPFARRVANEIVGAITPRPRSSMRQLGGGAAIQK